MGWSTSADFGRVSIDEPEIERETIYCPQVRFGGKTPDRPTMRQSECQRRIDTKAECSLKCPVATGAPVEETRDPRFGRCACGRWYDTAKLSMCSICRVDELMKIERDKKVLNRLKDRRKAELRRHDNLFKKYGGELTG
jgi:hypothetical protein